MDDYRLALLFSIFVLIPMAVWQIIGMVRKLKKMFSREKEEKKLFAPKQKEIIQFFEKASNKS